MTNADETGLPEGLTYRKARMRLQSRSQRVGLSLADNDVELDHDRMVIRTSADLPRCSCT